MVFQQRDRVPISWYAHNYMGNWDLKTTKNFLNGLLW